MEQPGEQNTHTLSFTARSGFAQALFDLLYTDSESIRLDRKYQSAKTWLAHSKIIITDTEQKIFDSFTDEVEAMAFIENRRKQRTH